MLPFFFRNYDPWIDQYVIFDDGSTDRSLDILAAHDRVEIRQLLWSDPNSLSLSLRDFFDQSWMDCRADADWVVTTKIDEHFFHPSMREYLATCLAAGVSLIPGLGYQMMTRVFPAPEERLCETRTMGVAWVQMNKLGIFDPSRIEETHFSPGRHRAAPTGDVVLPPKDEVLMFHYKYLGVDYTQRRHEQCRSRQGAMDIEKGWGHKWWWNRDQLALDWNDFESRLIDTANPAWDHNVLHEASRWWRNNDWPTAVD